MRALGENVLWSTTGSQVAPMRGSVAPPISAVGFAGVPARGVATGARPAGHVVDQSSMMLFTKVPEAVSSFAVQPPVGLLRSP